jgi:hypothetical protein
MDLREIGWDGVDWIDMAQDRDQWRALVNTVLSLRVPWGAGGFLRGCTKINLFLHESEEKMSTSVVYLQLLVNFNI